MKNSKDDLAAKATQKRSNAYYKWCEAKVIFLNRRLREYIKYGGVTRRTLNTLKIALPSQIWNTIYFCLRNLSKSAFGTGINLSPLNNLNAALWA
ncbi:hypothetical protein [Muriicola sp. Z0-33]|uniref:hypothetical protein n=1 Tax=Muriicola sp. Z0-33 TaxID=2816957 RepID=UPI0022388A9A|nr:hypothetical protein [Muriicola sp. Z0-33]MCW5515592.1 hypothetical protein [Muriicola sp. Z0-33]